MKLVGYVSVFSQYQDSIISIEEQKKRLTNYCNRFGHKLVRVYEEKTEDSTRPKFQEAIERLEKADGIIAVKLEYIVLSTLDFLKLTEDILNPNKKILIIEDLNSNTSTPEGYFALTMDITLSLFRRQNKL